MYYQRLAPLNVYLIDLGSITDTTITGEEMEFEEAWRIAGENAHRALIEGKLPNWPPAGFFFAPRDTRVVSQLVSGIILEEDEKVRIAHKVCECYSRQSSSWRKFSYSKPTFLP